MQTFISYLRLGSAVSFVGFTSVLWLAVAVFLLPFRTLRIKLCNYYGKFVGSLVARFFFSSKIVFHNREIIEQSKPAIYVTNHCSALDIFLSMWTCPIGGCGIAKKEIGRIPVFGQLYWLSGHLLINRQSREKAIEAMKNVGEFVREKKLGIWIWPEGTRSRTGRLMPFKKGFVHLAIATGLPVVPVIMHNTHKIWPKKSRSITPGRVDIDVCPAIDTSSWTVETIQDHIQETMKPFIDKLSPEQQPLEES